MPTISMDLRANYVVQTSAYARLLVGRPLTDRIINKRMKEGYFNNGTLDMQRKEKIKKSKSKSKRLMLKDVLKDFTL